MKYKSKVSIKGLEWTVHLLGTRSYKAHIHPEDHDSYGITYINTRKIYVDRNCGNIKHYLTHELMHAYIASCCLNTTHELSLVDLEEQCCEIIAAHLDDISINVYRLLNELT